MKLSTRDPAIAVPLAPAGTTAIPAAIAAAAAPTRRPAVSLRIIILLSECRFRTQNYALHNVPLAARCNGDFARPLSQSKESGALAPAQKAKARRPKGRRACLVLLAPSVTRRPSRWRCPC